MEVFFERNCTRGYHVYKKVWVVTVGGIGVRKSPKNLSIDTLWLCKTKELSLDIYLESCRGCVHCFCDGEVRNRKCEHWAQARGMAQSIIRIVIIRCKKNSL